MALKTSQYLAYEQGWDDADRDKESQAETFFGADREAYDFGFKQRLNVVRRQGFKQNLPVGGHMLVLHR